MAELRPYPIDALARRMFAELEHNDAIYDLPRRSFFLGDESHDYSVTFQGHRASTPFGPAAGPQTQMAQNMVLSWLGGSRIQELKTVQIMDELEIPRPCIDMRNVGYNAEWSQELKLEESLEEYVKGSMLIEMLVASGQLSLTPGFGDLILDMSVGYDLKGIQSPRVQEFIHRMQDCSHVVEKLRAELSPSLGKLRDLEFSTSLSDTLTLSTFHGCPPDEIEGIIDFLLRENELHCIIKFNPMLLGPDRARHLLHDVMGYQDVHVPDSAFTRDTKWDQAQGMMERLAETAESRGLGLGAKFTNTLIVENQAGFLPDSEKEVYLSGPPLHVLAINLVGQFREHFGDRFPVSFSAGIDRINYPDAVAIGLCPITTCSDLLQVGGYARQAKYHTELAKRMDAVGATDIEGFIQAAYGLSGESRSESILQNTEHYVEQVTQDPRYHASQNARFPKKIGSHLELWDCITCDKCIPVCPNNANFALRLPPMEIPIVSVTPSGERVENGTLSLSQKHQIANFADFCNDCGNCDVFCPEDGGPYIVKPRFFGSEDGWRESSLEGFYVEPDRVLARTPDGEFTLAIEDNRAMFSGADFEVVMEGERVTCNATHDVDFTWFEVLRRVQDAALQAKEENYVKALVR